MINVSKESKDKIKRLAKRFTANKPPLCKEHKPKGLPIDAPSGIDISESHPSYKFEQIVEQEADKQDNHTESVDVSLVRLKLREIFAQEFHSDRDTRSCIKCYKDNDEQSIRMKVPDNFKLEN